MSRVDTGKESLEEVVMTGQKLGHELIPFFEIATTTERRSRGFILRVTNPALVRLSTTLVRLAWRTEIESASAPIVIGPSARLRTVRTLNWLIERSTGASSSTATRPNAVTAR